MGGVDGNPDNHNPSPSSTNIRYPEKDEDDTNFLNILLVSFVGASITTFAVCNLRRTADWFFYQLSRPQSGKTGRSFRSAFQEEAWRRYTRRMQEKCEEEMERVERIRRMQSVFNRERNKHARDYESWRENGAGPGPDTYQHFQRDDWYWKTDTSHRNQRTNYRETPHASASSLSHHYSVLGLDRSRTTPYTEAEIKTAFRTKAKEFHPDQNQKNKETAEAKFKEVMTSYEAIKQERKDIKF